MKDSGIIRKAYFDALNGQLLLDGLTQVPIGDEKVDQGITASDLYVLIGAQNETDVSNKTNWALNVELALTIVNRREATNTKTEVEQISDQILGILFPTKTTNGLSVATPYTISLANLSGSEYYFKPIQSGGWQITKQLTFKNRLTQ